MIVNYRLIKQFGRWRSGRGEGKDRDASAHDWYEVYPVLRREGFQRWMMGEGGKQRIGEGITK